MKKGFTLLEMLAVLVLLLIVSAIVVPTTIKRTNKAEEDTITTNVLSYIKEVETAVVKEIGKDDGVNLEGLYQVNNGTLSNETTNYPISLQGSLPDSGTITINGSGKVIDANLFYKKFQVIYDGQNVSITHVE